MALLVSQHSCPGERTFANSQLLLELQGAYVPPRVGAPGLSSPGRPVFRGLQVGSTPDDKSLSDPPRLPILGVRLDPTGGPAGGPRLRQGWGVGRRRVPAETPGLAFPSHALRPGTQAPPPQGRRRRCYHGNVKGAGLGARSGKAFSGAGGAGRGEGAATWRFVPF